MKWRLYILALSLSGIWCGLLTGFPWLVRFGDARLAAAVSLVCSAVCHQDPIRSFRLLGVTLPVCSRCTAVYLGAFCGITVFPLLRNLAGLFSKITYLAGISTMLLGLDVAADVAGLWHNTFSSRSISGGFLGLTYSLGFLVLLERLRWESSVKASPT
jgi:uncharacterized membrane protein